MSNYTKRDDAMHALSNLETLMIAWEKKNHSVAYRERLICWIAKAKDAVMNIKVRKNKV